MSIFRRANLQYYSDSTAVRNKSKKIYIFFFEKLFQILYKFCIFYFH
ncbi:hypothetical protein LEP1GSC150_4490 [Leptospira interrogans serovar Copenhageni str. LT2050]|uniref:Uncharacterized protein n=1 Tax=Leptospira interrogans serovar Copenhageni str. LT2050 TaxID=1001598 RepID=M3G2X8_LEPIT|nr:hypothetical protein LEP1GSC150_4490 [Leptospira interrogans serovar Copenhageni str. LT2050]